MNLFQNQDQITARAFFKGERIDLRTFENSNCLDRMPLTVKVGAEGLVVLQRYGTVVFFNVSAEEEAEFMEKLESWITKAIERPEIEEVQVQLDESVKDQIGKDGTIILENGALERFQTVADILAKSVLLSYYEANIAKAFASIEPIAANFQRQRQTQQPGSELLKHIGNTLMIQQIMVGLVEIEEKPELLWDHPELDRLYLRLEDEYEIRERNRALERKLELISLTATTVLELVQHRSGIRLEWYILGLILVETLLTTYQIFFLRQ